MNTSKSDNRTETHNDILVRALQQMRTRQNAMKTKEIKAVNPGNRSETHNGILIREDGEWKVRSGYGTFHFCSRLQDKMVANKVSLDVQGSRISVTTKHRLVIDYHFIGDEFGA